MGLVLMMLLLVRVLLLNLGVVLVLMVLMLMLVVSHADSGTYAYSNTHTARSSSVDRGVVVIAVLVRTAPLQQRRRNIFRTRGRVLPMRGIVPVLPIMRMGVLAGIIADMLVLGEIEERGRVHLYAVVHRGHYGSAGHASDV
jgi:hypothetical protein